MKCGHSARDSGIVESWNCGILESWNPGILESWNREIVESWNPGILEYWESIPCHGFYWAASQRIIAAIRAGTATRFEIFPFSFSFYVSWYPGTQVWIKFSFIYLN